MFNLNMLIIVYAQFEHLPRGAMEDFKILIKKCRLNKHLTQKEAAALFGVNMRHWQAYERGERTPTFERLIAIADYFGCSIDYLVGRTDVPR